VLLLWVPGAMRVKAGTNAGEFVAGVQFAAVGIPWLESKESSCARGTAEGGGSCIDTLENCTTRLTS